MPIPPTPGWTVRKLDHSKLDQYLAADKELLAENANNMAELLDKYLAEACDTCIPRRRRGPPGRWPVY